MALDIKKMREKLEALKNKGGKIWKPQIGSKTKARILPAPDGDSFKDFHFHYGVGKQSILCPKRNFGEDCPICEFASNLYRQDDEESKEQAKKLFVKQRFYSPIVILGEDPPSTKVWGYPQGVYENLLEKVLNPEYGDITDVSTGTDIEIKYDKTAGKKYPNTDLEFARKPSSILDTIGEDAVADLLKSMPDFTKLFTRMSTQEVQNELDAWLAQDNGDDEGGDIGVSKFGDEKKEEVTDLDSAIDELNDA